MSVAVISCNNPKSHVENKGDGGQKLSFTSAGYNEQTISGNGQQTKVTATIPRAEGNGIAAKNINDKVFNAVRLIVGQENDSSKNYDELFKGFIRNYESFVSENKDYKLPWEADIKGSVEYETPSIINIKLVSYTMTGGNHGNPYTTSLLFNPADGKELAVSGIIKDMDAVTLLAEKKFREKYNIPADKPLNSAGYMFENDKFTLPANIFVTRDGLLLFYNVYEIAPYAEGTREVLLPAGEIKNYVTGGIFG